MLPNLLLRVLVILAGLVLTAGVAAAALVMFALWGVRAAWGRLTGRPVAPFIAGLRPFGAFAQAMSRGTAPAPASSASRTPRADALGARDADVTDVEPKRPAR